MAGRQVNISTAGLTVHFQWQAPVPTNLMLNSALHHLGFIVIHVTSNTNIAVLPLCPLDNFYGTPKPPAEPSPAAPPLNVSEALLPGARPSAQGKRKRNQSVSNMEQRASLEPPEEEEEDSPVVNGNGVAITPGAVR